MLVFGVIYAISQLTILSIIEPLGPDQLFRLQTTLSPDVFLAIKQGWADAGVLDAYWRHFWFDFPHPLWYGVFLAACAAWALRFSGRPAGYDLLILLPLVGAACDLIENSLHVLFLLEPGAIAQPWVAVSGTIARLKWLLLGLSLLGSASLVLCELRQRGRGRQRGR